MQKHYLLAGGIALLAIAGAFIVLNNSAIAPQTSPSASVSANPSNSVSPSVTSTVSASQNVIITSPTANATVGNPITVMGRGRFFEGSFQYALRDASGKVWYQSTGQIGAPENSQHQPFTVKIPVPVGTPRDLIVEVFAYSAMDGSIIDLVRVPVRLSSQETATVKVFLNNRRLNNNDSCDVVFPIDRTVIKTNEPAYIAVIELLKGPTGTDKDQQYHTSIPEDVKLNSLRITNGTAYVDFNSQLEYQVGGSCRVLNIRTQITNTLKQFSSVRNVVISINGRVDDILQP